MKRRQLNLKNNLPNKILSDEEVWFFDESRFGTHSKIGHAWFKTGTRTPIKIKLGYKNFYLYSAVNQKNGDEFTLMLPNVNTECMNVFIDEFVKAKKGKKVVMVMDGAAWHKSKSLKVHESIRIIIQPPYSPELNPVERLWQHIKDNTIKNQVFQTLEQLEGKVENFIKTIDAEIIKNVCNVKYI